MKTKAMGKAEGRGERREGEEAEPHTAVGERHAVRYWEGDTGE
jgi:hypothetical protein